MRFFQGLGNQRGTLVAGIGKLSLELNPGLLFLLPGMARDRIVGQQRLIVFGKLPGQGQGGTVAYDFIIQAIQLAFDIPILAFQLPLRRFPLRSSRCRYLRQFRVCAGCYGFAQCVCPRKLQSRLCHGIGGLVMLSVAAAGIELDEQLACLDRLSLHHMQSLDAGHIDRSDGLGSG